MATVTTRPEARADLEVWLRKLGRVAFPGAVTGFLIGGIGGRLAMLLLRVTSDDALHGLPTDDGFTIGIVSSETLFLLGVTTFLGLAAALLYAACRTWFPPAWRPWVSGAFFGLAGGADFVSTDGIDFALLSPLSLAIALFVILPTVYGIVMAWWVERWLASDVAPRSRIATRWPMLTFLPLAAFLALGPFGVALFLLLLGGWAVARAVPSVARLWWTEPVAWIGRGLVALAAVMGAIELARDAREILG